MTDLLFVLGMLGLCFLLGWPVCRWLPAEPAVGRWLAAPVMGFAVFAFGSSLFYRFGMAPGDAALLLLILGLCVSLWLAWRHRKAGLRPPPEALRFAVLAVAVLLLCLAPGWLGGEPFRVFQGNDQDQLNYLAFSSAMRSHSYAELMAMTPETATANDYLLGARKMLLARPAVCIAFAAMAGLSGLPTPDLAYAWTVGLQLLMLFAAAFVLRGVLGVRPLSAALAAAALTLGFFSQYVFDINAWSELAALPLGLLGLGLLLAGEATLWLLPLLTPLLAALLYLYPELLLAYGPAALAMLLFGQPGANWPDRVRRLITPAMAAGLAVLACVPLWQGTVGTLLAQQRNAVTKAFPWWRHFQGYLFGRDLDYFAPPPPTVNALDLLYALISLPIDFLCGLLGLFFLLPPARAPILLRLGWKLALAIFCAALLWAAVLAMRRSWQNPRWRGLALMVLLACLLPVGLLFLGRYWIAGKAWSMATPLLFLVLAAPLLRRSGARWEYAVVALYLATHLALGAWRPWAAAAPNGIHYALPYPSVPNATAKTDYDWNFAQWRPMLRQCNGISLNLENPMLERYVEVNLNELHVAWSSQRPADSDYGHGIALGLSPQLPKPDCLLTTGLAPGQPGQRVIRLGGDQHLRSFLDGRLASLELVATGLPATGLYAAEPYSGGLLRWTDGDTHILLPTTGGAPIIGLDLALWPVRVANSRLTLEVNGVILFDDVLPDGAWDRHFPLTALPPAPALDIHIRSNNFHAAGDPRTLGLALRHLALGR